MITFRVNCIHVVNPPFRVHKLVNCNNQQKLNPFFLLPFLCEHFSILHSSFKFEHCRCQQTVMDTWSPGGCVRGVCETSVCCCVFQEHDVETPYGMLHVVIHGAPKGNKPAILTYHDVGLNRE